MTALLLLLASATTKQADVEAKVNAAMAKMTPDEKLRIIGGTRGFYIRGAESIGMAPVKMSDGPVGVRNDGPTTAYSAGVCLASTFDEDLANEVGKAIGRDALGRGVGFWLGPGVNLARIVQNGRNFEYFGEDPWLASRMAVGEIEGVQSQGVIATVKHYAANNHEDDRNRDSSDVDEHTMRELYLKPFEAAVKEAHVGAVMCSYNLINGTYASANTWLLTKVLRTQWGFDGVMMSDWGAAHDGIADANAGLDLEMPSAENMTPAAMKEGLNLQLLDQATLDEKVRRILRVCYRYNLVGPVRQAIEPRNDPQNADIARREAEEGVVLLRNTGVLPLKAGADVLVLGRNAAMPITGGGGSSYTTPLHAESLTDALQRTFPTVHTIASATSDFRPSFEATKFSRLTAAYFKSKDFKGELVKTEDEAHLNHIWTPTNPSPAGMENFSVRWVGSLDVAETGDYEAYTNSDDGIRVWIDTKLVIDDWTDHQSTTDTATLHLSKGKHTFKVEYYQGTGEAVAQFALTPHTAESTDPKLNDALEKADAVIVGVGFNPRTEGEGHDRPFELPADQRALLDAAVAKSKRVIVVVNSGAGVHLAPWANKVAAVIEAWYPGQEGAAALANVISGKVNPSGKLATSFPAELKDTYYADAYPPVNHHIVYGEGVFTGYRWFDANTVKPLYPFGFGLSYTTFKIDAETAKIAGDAIHVTASVTNTGARDGAEVVELYVGPKDGGDDEPVKQLAAFKRVALKAGESKSVAFDIPFQRFATWQTQPQNWFCAAGVYNVYVGNSSRSTHRMSVTVAKDHEYGP
jgi:beta-glucosidase